MVVAMLLKHACFHISGLQMSPTQVKAEQLNLTAFA